jgi:mannose-6-phosphate isomerase-like protein (cupin superfamily)
VNVPPRVVETGLDAQRRAGVLADGAAANVIELLGATIVRLLRLDEPPWSLLGGAVAGGRPEPLRPGGLSVQLMMLDPPKAGGPQPAWRQVETQDITIVLDGELVVELEADGEHVLGPGETLVQCGTRHRLRARGGPVAALVAHLMPSGSATADRIHLGAGTDGSSGVRRVVTGVDAAGRSQVVHDGEPGWVLRLGDGDRVVLADVWQTGGPLGSVDRAATRLVRGSANRSGQARSPASSRSVRASTRTPPTGTQRTPSTWT